MEAGRKTGAGVGAWPRRRWLAGGLGLLLLAICVAIGVAAWSFSSSALEPNHSNRPEDVAVEGLRPGRIELERTEETERPGAYGLDWQGGRARVGAALGGDGETVTRRLLGRVGYLVPGMEVAVDSNFYAGDPRRALGLPFAEVPIRGELGAMPAWRVPGRGDTWAIFVHGINSTPQGGLRLLPTLHRAGLPTLLITYRDDLGAPPSPDGLHHMGQTEWRDLQAAARYALRHGARRLVLVGLSMGGSIVAQFMRLSPLAPRVAALVLDAPALDWEGIFEFGAAQRHLPGASTFFLKLAIGARIDVDWDQVDATRHPESLRLPTVIFHGLDDELVPISGSEELAEELPGEVTLYRAPRAGHVQSWNVDPPLYRRRLRRFLSRLGGDGR